MNLCIPKALLDQHGAVLGKTGSGKSSKLRHIVEYLLREGKRVCVIDPKGDWWGLKASADGKGQGFPVIAFGDFKESGASDVPVNEHSGKQVAELITSGNRPCIIGFRGWMPNAMIKFWLDFAPAMFNAQSGELYLVIDEVHNFAPKGKILDPQAGKCIHWTNRLMSEGRGLGLVCFIASQRPQKVHNDTLTCCETLIAGRVVHKADRAAIADWIEGCGDSDKGDEVLQHLAMCQRNQAFVWSPESGFGPKLVDFPMFTTFDSFAPPQLQKKVNRAGWSSINLDDVKSRLAAVIEEAKANDPAELKKEIGRLKVALAARPAAETTKEVIKEVPVFNEHETARLNHVALELERLRKDSSDVIALATEIKNQLPHLTFETDFLKTAAAVRTHAPKHLPPARAASRTAVGKVATFKDGSLTGTQQKILDCILMLCVRGLTPNREMIARWLDIHPNGGRYGSDLAALRSAGLIEGCELTVDGRQLANAIPTGFDALQDVLEGTQCAIMNALGAVDSSETVTRDELADKLGIHPNGGRYGSDLARLRKMGVIPERGEIRLLGAALK